MNYTYILSESALLIFPVIGLIISYYAPTHRLVFIFKASGIFLLVHNLLFVYGYSLKGDYIDYTIFALEYGVFIVFISVCTKIWKNVYCRIFKISGYIFIVLGIMIGAIGIFLSVVISMDYEADRTVAFYSNNKSYEIRIYMLGFVTFESDKYTLDTYRSLNISRLRS